MKIKRYTAASMRAALALVRAEQGPDAVILSSRRGDDGIEVIAAVHYDEALFADAKRQPSAPIIAAPAAVPSPAPAPARRSDAAECDAMQREWVGLRGVLDNGLPGMTWNDKRLREHLRARVLEELTAMDIAPDVALTLAALTPQRTTLDNPSHIPLALLAKHLPIVNDTTCVAGGITAVVGPTGAGKTTTIAKLAARWCMQHGSQDLALVSTASYRIGRREQPMTYPRILVPPIHAANRAKELARVPARLKDKKRILIATAGMGPRDVRLPQQLAA